MKIYLDHDWQGNMSSPRKILGEKTKLHLFFFLAFIWVVTGLTGHEPWRPHESATISQILEIYLHNQFLHKLANRNLVRLWLLHSFPRDETIPHLPYRFLLGGDSR